MEAGGPYRSTDVTTPRYLCIVCYRSASILEPGVCRHCGVARLPLDNPEVQEEVRKRAEALFRRRASREWTLLLLAITLLALIPYFFLGWMGWIDIRPKWDLYGYGHRNFFHFVLVPIWLLTASLCMFVYVRLRKGSALATETARAVRLKRELGEEVFASEEHVATHAGPDPEELRLGQLLEWLKVEVEP